MVYSHKLISITTFAERLSVSRSSLYRLLNEDETFPKPVRLGLRRIAFVEAEAASYIEGLIAARLSTSHQSQGGAL